MVLERRRRPAERGELGQHIAISTQRVLIGFAIGAALGLVLGALVGLSRLADALLAPTLGALRAVPSLAWVPLLILWMKIGEDSKVTLIAIGAFFPVFTTVALALRHVDRHLVEAGRAFGLGRAAADHRAAARRRPAVFSGLRLALAQAWLFLVAAELIASSMGLGFLLMDSQNNGRTDRLLLAIVLLAVLGKLTDALLGLAEKWAVKTMGMTHHGTPPEPRPHLGTPPSFRHRSASGSRSGDRADADPVASGNAARRLPWHTAHTSRSATPAATPTARSRSRACAWFAGGTLNVAVQLRGPARRRRAAATRWRCTSRASPATAARSPTPNCSARSPRPPTRCLALGIGKGDRVVVYLPVLAETVIITLAVARIGAVHSLVFGGFSAEALRFRVEDTGAKLLVTTDGQFRRGAAVPVKDNADAAVAGRERDRARPGGPPHHRGGRLAAVP